MEKCQRKDPHLFIGIFSSQRYAKVKGKVWTGKRAVGGPSRVALGTRLEAAGNGKGKKIQIEKENVLKRNDLSLLHFFILGDTSYGACCVDEVAAKHLPPRRS